MLSVGCHFSILHVRSLIKSFDLNFLILTKVWSIDKENDESNSVGSNPQEYDS